MPLAIEYIEARKLIPYAQNARTHSPEQIDIIANSMREFGWTNPVLIDERLGIIAGHGRVLAAEKLAIENVPTIQIPGLSDAQRRALIIADNQTALRASWDESILRLELEAIHGAGFDLGVIGFSVDELASLLQRTDGLTDPDAVPEPPKNPTTILGDIWRLGRHRLVCGDSTSATDVALALNGVVPNLMVTDPPYGVEYDADWRNRATGSIGKRLGGSWATSTGDVIGDAQVDWSEAYALFSGDVAYVWHAGNQAAPVAGSLTHAGFHIRGQIIWVKQNFVISRGHYHSQHEPCWYAVRKGQTGHWQGDRTQSTVWEIANRSAMGGRKDDADTNHSTQKPVECMKRPIENNSSPGQAVYDPFVGSGTTIIAAEMTGRACHALELDPVYCDVAVQRWQNFTGQKAMNEKTGVEFAPKQEAA